MVSVLQELSQWATSLRYWEQAALDKIVAGHEFTDADYDQLLSYLLQDAGLEPEGDRPSLALPASVDSSTQPAAPVTLVRISNLQHINALCPKDWTSWPFWDRVGPIRF